MTMKWQLQKKFLTCFIKAEFLSDLSPKQLASLDVDSITHHLDLKDMFIGKITGDILREESKPHHFLIKVNKSFRQAARHLLHTFPLYNPLLVSLSALDLSAPNHSVVGKCLKILPGHFKHYLSASEEEQLLIETKDIQLLQIIIVMVEWTSGGHNRTHFPHCRN